jgi:excisionase family DNA binding protein
MPSDVLPSKTYAIEAVATSGGLVEPLLLTPRQAAAVLAISERTLWSLAHERGELPFVKLGTAKRYRLADLRDFCARLARGGQGPK